MADYYDVFNFKSSRKLDLKVYMFIVSPLVASDQGGESQESDDWEGSINYLKKSPPVRRRSGAPSWRRRPTGGPSC